VNQVAHATLRKLSEIKGISEQKAQKLKELAYKVVPIGFSTATQVRPYPLALEVGGFYISESVNSASTAEARSNIPLYWIKGT
jgi:hypothetical protein